MDDSSTSTQEANVQESRLILRKRILSLRATQVHFIPEAALPLEDCDCDEPESISLHLPSDLTGSCSLSPAGQALAKMEAQLHFAQATDTLSGLRRSLAIHAELSRYKTTQLRGQHASTHARTLLSTAQEKITTYAARYRRARLAYSQLMGPGDWENTLQPLMDGDIQTLATHQDEAELTAKTGYREGHRIISWIYMVPGTAEESTGLDEGVSGISSTTTRTFNLDLALHVEWLKARA